ncbi:hypothetical protein [Bernardetia sp.]|uniref:hypothetical protein n=1 Tax=Bernardetia sp. TaxID=1937974 RepID=UPI0025C366AE|nr:hypothetical protein [Bernardetia sp.]
MNTKVNFKWSNFLQGGLLLYAGGLFLLYRFFQSLQEFSLISLLGLVVGIIFLLMATGLTFFGDVGGLLFYLQEKKEEHQLSTFGKKYHHLSDEEFTNQISEIVENIPLFLKYKITNTTNNLEQTTQYIVAHTKWSLSNVEFFIKEVQKY